MKCILDDMRQNISSFSEENACVHVSISTLEVFNIEPYKHYILIQKQSDLRSDKLI